jgi:ubiquinone/menaquinone biosynthesis C-methylase UbiE
VDKRIENEIEHGKYLLEHDADLIWNRKSEAGKRRWQRRIKVLMANLKPGMNILEVGCGTGSLTRELVKSDVNVIAIDISPDLLDVARKEVAINKGKFLIQNAYQMTFSSETFDAIVGSSVLHHLDRDKALEEFFRVLRPGGKIFFTEPNMLNPQIVLQKNIPWLKRKLGDSPDETAFIRWLLHKKLMAIGFTDINIQPFDFLHPKLPKVIIPVVERLFILAEKVPLLREFSGSLYVTARK